MIVITGATGQLGKMIVERLAEKVPASQIGVSVRDPQKAQAWIERGIRVRQGNFDNPASLRGAFAGASQVLIISGTSLGPLGVAQHGNAIRAAKIAGAERILYTSHMAAANPRSAFSPARDHAATEALLEASGVPFTSLRNGYYAESALWQLSEFTNADLLVLPQDGPVSWTSRRDLAEAAVIALTSSDIFSGVTPPLVNTAELYFADLARMAAEISGRPIVRQTVTDAEFKQSLLDSGFPAAMADGVLGSFAASRSGDLASSDPALEKLLGRAPTSFRSILAESLENSAR